VRGNVNANSHATLLPARPTTFRADQLAPCPSHFSASAQVKMWSFSHQSTSQWQSNIFKESHTPLLLTGRSLVLVFVHYPRWSAKTNRKLNTTDRGPNLYLQILPEQGNGNAKSFIWYFALPTIDINSNSLILSYNCSVSPLLQAQWQKNAYFSPCLTQRVTSDIFILMALFFITAVSRFESDVAWHESLLEWFID